MADLITTIQETVTVNGSLRGSTNSVTTSDVNDVLERIVTCTKSVVTTIAVFAALPSTSPGAIDVDRTKYVRVTNIDPLESINLAVQGVVTSYTILLTPGNSHILSNGAGVMLGEAGATTFGTLEDLASLQVKPVTANDVRVEMFVGVE